MRETEIEDLSVIEHLRELLNEGLKSHGIETCPSFADARIDEVDVRLLEYGIQATLAVTITLKGTKCKILGDDCKTCRSCNLRCDLDLDLLEHVLKKSAINCQKYLEDIAKAAFTSDDKCLKFDRINASPLTGKLGNIFLEFYVVPSTC